MVCLPKTMDKMKERLKDLISEKFELSRAIDDARQKGDLSENYEYFSAREAMERNAEEHNRLIRQMSELEIYKGEEYGQKDSASIYDKVTMPEGNCYQIFSPLDVIFLKLPEGSISTASAVAKSLLGRTDLKVIKRGALNGIQI